MEAGGGPLLYNCIAVHISEQLGRGELARRAGIFRTEEDERSSSDTIFSISFLDLQYKAQELAVMLPQ